MSTACSLNSEHLQGGSCIVADTDEPDFRVSTAQRY